ncbi:MAG TPA: efflux RND transporter periplasmic adaptor subunit [Nevskia sp.]|nr:efflux RND transporter periplasmic adaptor subunit [Nevskia sp.]
MNDKTALLNQLRIDRSSAPPPADRGWLKWAALGLALLLLAGGLGYWLSRPSGVPVKVATAQALRSANPAAAAGASLLDASGYVVARRAATVAAKITGKVTEVMIEEGQHVKAGQVVATLDATNIRAAFDQAVAERRYAQASLEAVKVQLGNAERNYRRDQGLVAEHFISESDLDTARTSFENLSAQLATARSNVEVAERGVAVAQRNLDDTVVRAPFDGVVTTKDAQPGEMVSPISAGGGFTRTGIGTIVDMDSLEVEVDVNESFINRVHPEQPATVRLNAYTDWEIPAYVIAVIPTADRSKATVKVRVGFKTKGDPRILPEMGARVAFLSEAPPQPPAGAQPAAAGVLVPPDAVLVEGSSSSETGTVYVIRGEDVVERRAVRLGARGSDGQTVLSGLSSGERVAIGDFSKLKDGAKVKVQQ